MRIALYPGSFDTVTYGHLDVIRRASRLFDKVIVGVSNNSKKVPTFTLEERTDLIRRVLREEHLEDVEVGSYNCLLVDYAAEVGATVIVRGLRAVADFEYEFQMSLANHKLRPNIETVFVSTLERNLFISSSLVKEIAAHGGSIKSFVPAVIIDDIMTKLYHQGEEQ